MKYYINEDKNAVTCIMSYKYDTPMEGRGRKTNIDHAVDYICGVLARDYLGKVSLDTLRRDGIRLEIETLCLPFVKRHVKDEYKGTAHCSPLDTFDAEVGKEIARARCLRNFYSDVAKAIIEIMTMLESALDILNRTGMKAEGSAAYWQNILDMA